MPIINGTTGDDMLESDLGDIDTLIGGIGNDTYTTDLLLVNARTVKIEDKLIEKNNEGSDTLILRSSTLALTTAATISLPAGFEHLDLSQTGATLLNIKGGTGSNTLTGNSAANTIDGGTGADVMIGGDGDDTYIIDAVGDIVTEASGEGIDTVISNIRNTTTSAVALTVASNVEKMFLKGTGLFNVTGNTLDNHIVGNASINTLNGGDGNDTLDGGAGADRLIGGDGDDVYYIDNAGDVIVENNNEGSDTVYSAINYTLGTHLENLVLTGRAAVGTGNALNNTLTGNDGNNTLDGAGGTNTLIGGKGNDIYIVNSASDTVIEALNQGTDTVRSQITYTLGANIENLVLLGGGSIDATGNALKNTLTGNSASNTLDGAGGADVLIGGAGDDTFMIDLLATPARILKLEDKVTEKKAEGYDTTVLRTAGDLNLAKAGVYKLDAFVEKLDASATGSNLLNLTGNAENNHIIGNDAANLIDGGTGDDLLEGGLGNDTLLGGTGNDTLAGEAGADVMTGGTGRDSYVFRSASDSTLAGMDRITDFKNGEDRILLDGANGYTVALNTAYATTGTVSAIVTAINNDGSISDRIVFFSTGNNGYIYVKGDGNGATGYDGLLVQLDKVKTPLSNTSLPINAAFDNESAPSSAFTPGQTVIGSLSSFTDVDAFSFTAPGSRQLVITFDAPTSNVATSPTYTVSVKTTTGATLMEWTTGGDRTFTLPVTGDDYVIAVTGTTSKAFSAGEYTFTTSLQSHTVLALDTPESATISQAGEVDSYQVALTAGDFYHITANATDHLDTKIRIFDQYGREIMVQDDSALTRNHETANILDTRIGFVAPASGTYTITVEAIKTPANPIKEDITDDNGDPVDYGAISLTGDYTLTVNQIDPADLAAEIIEGQRWGDPNARGTPVTITYSFESALSAAMQANSGSVSFTYQAGTFKAMTAQQQAAITTALQEISKVAGITFQQVSSGGELNFGWMKPATSLGSSGSAYKFNGTTYLLTFDDSAQTEVDNASVIFGYSGSSPNGINMSTIGMQNLILHETLHALGLEHGGHYTPPYGPTGELPVGFNTSGYTVMAYAGIQSIDDVPSTLQMTDVAALRALYGPSMGAGINMGNDIYTFPNSTTEVFKTIYDDGGNDTLDASAQTVNSTIFLQSGSSSSIGKVSVSDVPAAIVLKATVPGEFLDRAYQNITIDVDSVIENAKGGSANDYISGNSANNTLWGNAGNDMLIGLDDDDRLIGGAGNDLLVGGDGADTFVFDSLQGIDTVRDFNAGDGDVIDIRGILNGYDLSDDITQFVRITDDGTDSTIAVSVNGTGSGWQNIAVFQGVTGLTDEAALLSATTLVIS